MSKVGAVKCVEVAAMPAPHPNQSEVEFLLRDGAASVVYPTNPWAKSPRVAKHGDASTEDRYLWAVVWLDDCQTAATGPNDEAVRNHPLARFGLRCYTIQEVLNSPWIAERARVEHMDGRVLPEWHGSMRHFVFAMKEGMVEFLARDALLIGTFDSYDLAWKAAFQGLPS